MPVELGRGAWEAERKALADRLARWCGAIPKRGDLAAKEVWRREFRTHTELKVTYEGDPGERVPAYLLLPREPLARPAPAVLAAHQCAHQCDIGKEQVVGKCVDWPDQAYGLELVREGFVVLAPDANKVGERFDPKLRKAWQTAKEIGDQHACCVADGGSWGRIRWKPVFDVMRGIDFLVQRPEVDARRIGMIGHSLGADTVAWAMPFEERIRAAAISGGGLMIEGDWLPYGIPYADILRLVAPRPFFEFTGTRDFAANWHREGKPATTDECMARKRRSHDIARAVYALHGKAECLACMEFDCDHAFPPEGRRAAYAWLKKHLA